MVILLTSYGSSEATQPYPVVSRCPVGNDPISPSRARRSSRSESSPSSPVSAVSPPPALLLVAYGPRMEPPDPSPQHRNRHQRRRHFIIARAGELDEEEATRETESNVSHTSRTPQNNILLREWRSSAMDARILQLASLHNLRPLLLDASKSASQVHHTSSNSLNTRRLRCCTQAVAGGTGWS
ncbi:hypothetical protein BJ508DRAFT_329598 [Ascobolus immersus RN42]|uniref:Uncharacterized protein n=1 Tax=Ascobolus immersus RN42 TaxID=1160509 RepID=A0A3N4HW96_ASCIM|nr:hypothetical protein BJ508DRAFT_329598 [Ascobolus immersus RN42]